MSLMSLKFSSDSKSTASVSAPPQESAHSFDKRAVKYSRRTVIESGLEPLHATGRPAQPVDPFTLEPVQLDRLGAFFEHARDFDPVAEHLLAEVDSERRRRTGLGRAAARVRLTRCEPDRRLSSDVVSPRGGRIKETRHPLTKFSSLIPSRFGPREWPDICQLSEYCCIYVLKSSLESIDSITAFKPGPVRGGEIKRVSCRAKQRTRN